MSRLEYCLENRTASVTDGIRCKQNMEIYWSSSIDIAQDGGPIPLLRLYGIAAPRRPVFGSNYTIPVYPKVLDKRRSASGVRPFTFKWVSFHPSHPGVFPCELPGSCLILASIHFMRAILHYNEGKLWGLQRQLRHVLTF